MIKNIIVEKSELDTLLISEYQNRFFLEWVLDPEGNTYNVSLVYKISGNLDKHALKIACDKFICKNEVFYSKYNIEGNRVYRENYSIGDFYYEIEVDNDIDLDNQIRQILYKPFDLTQDILFQIHLLISQEHTEYYFIITAHHIVSDGITGSVLIREIAYYYNQIINHLEFKEKLHKSFTEAVLYEHTILTDGYKSMARKYWQNFIDDIPLNIDLPYKTSYNITELDNRLADKSGEFMYFNFDKRTTDYINKYIKQQGCTLFIFLSTIYGFILSRYSNQQKILINYPVNMRSKEFSNLAGCFVNNLPLKLEFDNSKQNLLEDILTKLTKQRLDVKDYQYYLLTNIIQDYENIHGMRLLNPFNVTIAQTNLNTLKFELRGVNVEPVNYPWSSNTTNELELMYDEYGKEEIKFKFGYRKLLFDNGLIQNFVESFKQLVQHICNYQEKFENNQIAETEHINLQKYSILSAINYQKLIYDWNQTEKPYPDDKTIHELFEEQVQRTPHNIAVIYEDTKLTYQQLNQKANQLAHYLRATYDIKGDDLIALCLDRSEHMLIAILAVLKSGGAYVPIAPDYPEERISYILEDTKASVMIVNSIFYNSYAGKNSCIDIIAIDTAGFAEVLEKQAISNLDIKITSNNLAYVIYTSGTTGKPKGVMIEHQGVCNRIAWMNNQYPLEETDVILQKTPYTFDVSVWELLWANWFGACIVFAKPDGHKDAAYLIDTIESYNVNVIHFVPSMLKVFNETLYTYNEVDIKNKLLTLRYVFCSGEELLKEQVEGFKKILPQVGLHNLYGPTEASIDVLHYDCNNLADSKSSVYIGRPIQNTKSYILDSNLNPVPQGVVGELYIGGIGIARGYLNQAKLTAQRFIANPFQSEEEKGQGKNKKLYKTGDLVRYLADGNIEYIGRNDFQVKIRGFRIELGEIESVLSGFPGIKQAVVLAKGHKDKPVGNYLAAYYAAEGKLDEKEIIKHLGKSLPEYMVPNVLVYLEKLPLTVNGKLDRSSLPDPEYSNESSYMAPRNELEAQVCAVYAEVLGLDKEKVGINDNFFKLGGDSIISIQLASRLCRHLHLNVSVKDIFEVKTVEKLCDRIITKQLLDKNSHDKTIIQENGALSGKSLLLPIQEWFLNKVITNEYKDPGHWNQSFLIRVKGLNQELLFQSMVKLIEYHDVFRLGYTKTGKNQYIQYYRNMEEVSIANEVIIKYLNLSDLSKDEALRGTELQRILTTWQNNFTLTDNKPLYSIGYITGYSDGSDRIFVALHHLLVDALSWRLIAHDLKRIYTKLYEAKQSGKLQIILEQSSEDLLGNKSTSYRQWASIINRYSSFYPEELMYWNRQTEPHKIVNYNQQLTKLIESDSTCNCACFSLNEELTAKLLTETNDAYHTEVNDLLLSAFGQALTLALNNIKVHYITLEGHGREEIVPNQNITHTVGWFTSMYPVCLNVEPDNLSETIINIKEQLRSIPNKGIGYGVLFGYGKESLPQISFNYLGQFGPQSSKPSNDEWQITGETSGESMSSKNHDADIISTNGWIIDGKLNFVIKSKLSSIKVNKLALDFESTLVKVINQAANLETKYYSINDFLYNFKEVYTKIDNNSIIKSPIFVFPPASGGYESYMSSLVPQLSDWDLVLFNNYCLHISKTVDIRKEKNNIDFQFLAKFYIQYITKLHDGPYNLLGWSFGGVLAFETARQLEKLGKKINFIFLFDSYFDFKSVTDNINNNAAYYYENFNYKYLSNNWFNNQSNAKIILYKAIIVPSLNQVKSDLEKISPNGAINDDIVDLEYKLVEAFTNSQLNNLDRYVSISSILLRHVNSIHDHLIEKKELLDLVHKDLIEFS